MASQMRSLAEEGKAGDGADEMLLDKSRVVVVPAGKSGDEHALVTVKSSKKSKAAG